MKNSVLKRKEEVVGVIAGTPVDTVFGLSLLKKHGIKAIGYPMSDSPQEQTCVQVLSRDELTKKLIVEIQNLVQQGVGAIVIYCNSLSGAVDLTYVRQKSCLPVFSPIDSYVKLSRQYVDLAVFAANGQSGAHIEKMLLKGNGEARITGLNLLKVVEDIEKELPADKIVYKHGLNSIILAFFQAGVEILILGCTHFDYLYDELVLLLGADKVFLPANIIVAELNSWLRGDDVNSY